MRVPVDEKDVFNVSYKEHHIVQDRTLLIALHFHFINHLWHITATL